jgi:hypothetical protein
MSSCSDEKAHMYCMRYIYFSMRFLLFACCPPARLPPHCMSPNASGAGPVCSFHSRLAYPLPTIVFSVFSVLGCSCWAVRNAHIRAWYGAERVRAEKRQRYGKH